MYPNDLNGSLKVGAILVTFCYIFIVLRCMPIHKVAAVPISNRNQIVSAKAKSFRGLAGGVRAFWNAICVSAIVSAGALGQEEGVAPTTNLELLRHLASGIATRAARLGEVESSAREASVSVYPKEHAWYIESALAEGLTLGGFSLTATTQAPVQFEFGILDAGIEYANAAKESMFGSKRVERMVRLELEAKIRVHHDTTLERVFVATYKDTVVDKIDFSAIQRVENRLIPITQGILPREGFFASLAEPLIVVGSIAVAVLLLFNVRS